LKQKVQRKRTKRTLLRTQSEASERFFRTPVLCKNELINRCLAAGRLPSSCRTSWPQLFARGSTLHCKDSCAGREVRAPHEARNFATCFTRRIGRIPGAVPPAFPGGCRATPSGCPPGMPRGACVRGATHRGGSTPPWTAANRLRGSTALSTACHPTGT